MKKSRKIVAKQMVFLAIIFLFVLFLAPFTAKVHAQSDSFGLQPIEETTMLGGQDIRLTIAKIIRALLGFLGIVALCLVIYAGYLIMTAGGNEQKVETGKKILVNAIIGTAIILSSFAITQFIINRLAEATGMVETAPRAGPPARQTFTGSGSLGTVVRDHYPFRDQTDVPRNTRISVTFNEALNPESVFVDSNDNGVLGDCVNTDQPDFDWNSDCDRLDTASIDIRELDNEGVAIGSALEMVAMASLEGTSVYGIVLRPLSPLGNDSGDVGYLVDLTENIRKEDGGASMFIDDRDGHYEWKFETGTEFDFTPPHIVSVYPAQGETVARNIVIQINFSEAVDPIMVQGIAGTFYNIIFGDEEVTGVWRLANAYKTAEFVSDQSCGENSCGDPMYCLPTACATGDTACFESRHILTRAANLISAGSFEAIPFSGVMDMAGNALDGDNDGVADGKPTMPGNFQIIGAGEQSPDNYFWNFNVQNVIDRAAPYVIQIAPGLDQEDVAEDADLTVLFSKPMWTFTLNAIAIEEYGLDYPFWYRATANTEAGKTLVNIDHRIFGPNDEDAYYFTSVPEQVKSLNQNCVYPGRGPAAPAVLCQQDEEGNIITGCVPTTYNSNEDTGCAQTTNPGDLLKGDVEECLEVMEMLSPL